MIKPPRLKSGDTIAAISISSGLAGESDILWRYEQGKKQLEALGFNVVELKMTLAGIDEVYAHPEKRAKDLENALIDPNIKAIICNIGGYESYRIFEYIDLNIIRENPKIFIGYSDITAIHQMFRMAGVVSYYGPCVLVDFAENKGVYDFTKLSFEEVLMKESIDYTYSWRKQWTSQRLAWNIENKDIARTLYDDEGPQVLQGQGTVLGKTLGGCMDLFMLRGTELYPKPEDFENAILLLETSEEYLEVSLFEAELRTMAIMGNLQRVSALMFGKPQDNKYFDEYKDAILKVLKEFKLGDLPVLYNCNFGHTEPKWTVPLGIMAELNLNTKTFRLLENATVKK